MMEKPQDDFLNALFVPEKGVVTIPLPSETWNKLVALLKNHRDEMNALKTRVTWLEERRT